MQNTFGIAKRLLIKHFEISPYHPKRSISNLNFQEKSFVPRYYAVYRRTPNINTSLKARPFDEPATAPFKMGPQLLFPSFYKNSISTSYRSRGLTPQTQRKYPLGQNQPNGFVLRLLRIHEAQSNKAGTQSKLYKFCQTIPSLSLDTQALADR